MNAQNIQGAGAIIPLSAIKSGENAVTVDYAGGTGTILIKNDNEEVTQKEIAKELNISRSYVSRIEKRALTKMLREFLKNNKDI